MDQDTLSQDAQFLWADMLDEARGAGADDLVAWLERARPVSFDGAVMTLATKQKWAARNLTGKYRQAVEALMSDITMEPVRLEVNVEEAAPAGACASPAAAGMAASAPLAGAPAPAEPPTAAQAAGQAPMPATAEVSTGTFAPAIAQATPAPAGASMRADAAAGACSSSNPQLTQAPAIEQPTGMTAVEADVPVPPAAPATSTTSAYADAGANPAVPVPAPAPATPAPEPPLAAPAPAAAQEPQPPQAPLSAAALAGKAMAQGRTSFVGRSLTNHALLQQKQREAQEARGFQRGVETQVETQVETPAGTATTPATPTAAQPPQTPIPVLEEGTEQKDEVKAQSGTDFTFDTYVVGDSNVMAYRVAKGVAEQPDGSLFNPVFIWGPSGNGKTHLMLAIQAYISENQPRTRVEYISADMFLTRYIDEVHNQKLRGSAVLKDMNDIDVLLVDDVQEFKNQQQETVGALFNIFNSFMLAGNKQIVLAADRAPDYLDLDPRLKTRFSQGMVQDIKAPTWEMKLSILKSFYERYRARNGMSSVRIDEEGFRAMAQRCPDNPRQMTGLINSIMFNAERDPSILTPDGIAAFIDSQYNVASVISLDKIMAAVTKEYNVTYEQITSRSRTAAIKEARQVYMWLASQLTDETYQSIGDEVGLNHSTITHGIKVINEKRNADHNYARLLEDFKNRLLQ